MGCDINVGDVFTLFVGKDEKVVGKCMYVGEICGKNGIFVGVRLDKPYGKNAGSINDYNYFECDENHGFFIEEDKLRHHLKISGAEENKLFAKSDHQRPSKTCLVDECPKIIRPFNNYLLLYFQPLKGIIRNLSWPFRITRNAFVRASDFLLPCNKLDEEIHLIRLFKKVIMSNEPESMQEELVEFNRIMDLNGIE